MSYMGTPADGFRKQSLPPRESPKPAPMTIREAVTRYGDDWRLMMSHNHFIYREHMECNTHDFWDALHMVNMERGLKSRIDVEDIRDGA